MIYRKFLKFARSFMYNATVFVADE